MKRLLILTIFILTSFSSAFAIEYGYTSKGFKYVKHTHSESSYQHAWCFIHNGIEEYETNEKTRVDCLTNVHAVEFDFANKWAESVGQRINFLYCI